MPNYEDSDAYRAEQLVNSLHDPRTCPLHVGDTVEFVHSPYNVQYYDAVVTAIRYQMPNGMPEYRVTYYRLLSQIDADWWLRDGLIRLTSATEVLGEDYLA